ncbi:MAG: hypothetical protein K2K68_01035 [Duncaniella sp.]|nr:hypothetical protein [Duncaniella sp.]
MKKLILILSLILLGGVYNNISARKAYAELLGFQKGLFSNKVKVHVDFGQNVSFWKQGNMTIVDEDGKDIVFNSMVDAMNFMGERGWEFQQAYVVTESGQNVYHWLLSKEVDSDEDIKAGFNVRSDVRKEDLPKYTLTFLKRNRLNPEWDLVKSETKQISKDELNSILEEWRSQSDEKYEYDCQVKREK